MSKHPGLDGVLRSNRLDGAGLYLGRRGRIGPVDATRLEAFLLAWHRHDPHLRMGVIPLMAAGALDDGRPRPLDALLGDRAVDFNLEEDLSITGTPRSLLANQLARLQAAMKPGDLEALADRAAAHDVGLGDLPGGPWAAVLYRAPTFALGRKVPDRVELLAGLGMRPKAARGLPAPAGMSAWKTPHYVIFGRPLAEVRAPALVTELDLDGLHAGIAAAQADLDAAGRDPLWQRMMKKERWMEAWLEVQLYVRLT